MDLVPEHMRARLAEKSAARAATVGLVDHNARVIDGLGLQWPGSRWDVLRGANAPPMALCGSYNDIWTAHNLLRAAGFAPCRHAAPTLCYDRRYHIRMRC